MVETFQNLYLGFTVALSPPILFYAFVGCVVGTLVLYLVLNQRIIKGLTSGSVKG